MAKKRKKDAGFSNLAWALAGATTGVALYFLLKPEIQKMVSEEEEISPYPVAQPKVPKGFELLG